MTCWACTVASELAPEGRRGASPELEPSQGAAPPFGRHATLGVGWAENTGWPEFELHDEPTAAGVG